MEEIEKHLFWAIIAGLVAGMMIGFGVNSCTTEPEAHFNPETITDTIRLKEFIPVEKQVPVIRYRNRYLPSKVIEYIKPDTTRRDSIASDTIITGLKLSGSELEVQTISPEGISQISDYKLPQPAGINITLDHKVPVAAGGGDDIDNLQLACYPHNHEKGAMLPEEWEEFQNL